MRKFAITFLAFVALTPVAEALACQFDTDCSPGSKCLKSSMSLYGVCAGGLFPGNDNDRRPVRDPLDPNQKVGDTCSFDVQCGPGNKCLNPYTLRVA